LHQKTLTIECKNERKNSCAGLKVASPGDGDGVQTGTGRYQTDFGRYIFVADMGEQLPNGIIRLLAALSILK
jgi:hypothetical protein